MSTRVVLDHASAIRPCLGERVSGDTVVVRPLEQGLFLAIVDVLGHGDLAHELTHVIERYLDRYCSFDVSGLMAGLHQHLQGTRGAAVGLCAINSASGSARYAGIGNTAMRYFGSTETRFVSRDGVVGQNMRSPLLQQLELSPGGLIAMYTDGVSDRFTCKDYPGIGYHTAQDVADNVVTRFGKDHDDAACIAVRYTP